MFTIGSLFQHFQKTVHDGGVLRRNIALTVEGGVKVEEIEDSCLHGVDERFLIKTVFLIPDALFQQIEIPAADDLLLRRKVHHGIDEQSQRPFHTIIALRRAQLDKAIMV